MALKTKGVFGPQEHSESETGVNSIERTDHNGVHHCSENQNFEYHPLVLEAAHSKSNHHRYPWKFQK